MIIKKEKLNRSIGRLGFAALAINGLIGAGIFVLPASAAKVSGQFSPWMFVFCGLLMATVVLSFASLSSYFKGTGGPVVYAQEAFGSAVAFQTGWLLYVGRVTALAANSNALLFYLALIYPGFATGLQHDITLSVIIILLAATNIFGVRSAMGTVNFITFLKLIPLLLFIIFGVGYIQPNELFSTADFNADSFDSSLLLLIYAFIGFESAVIPAGEAREPRKDIPKALIQTLIFTTLLYFLIQSVSVAVLPQIASSTSPLSDAAGKILGSFGAMMMTIAAIVSITGNLASVMVAAPRMTYALSINGNLPKWFGEVNERFKVPANSIYFMASLALILALTGSFVKLAIISSLARMIGYGVCMASLPVISARSTIKTNRFKLPGGMLIPLVALGITIWLSLQANSKAWIYTGAFIMLGGLLYVLEKYQRKAS
ncbi:MAG TPA: amino acid permease [Aeromonadales bacterium]|nr:amino acid permease [Aeromonadales bacterium]